jgi:uncharacterized membrane protein
MPQIVAPPRSSAQEVVHRAVRSIAFGASRVDSVDLVRGVVMILMALDHARDYLHFDSLLFSPTDLQRTTPALFATRLVTHLCAPTFILLAGVSAHFVARKRTLKGASLFLLTRGAWLVLLQMTVIRFAWNFDPGFHYNSSNIISTIGFSMMILAGLIHLRPGTILAVGLTLAIGHNALDHVAFADRSAADVLWSFLHVRKLYVIGHGYSFLFLYPLVPWMGVMALGYCLGRIYDHDWPVAKRKRALLTMGGASLLTFVLLRWSNLYGDPSPWTRQRQPVTTILSFLNLEKYPPSLLYLCLTLGVTLLLLGALEGRSLRRWQPIVTYGKVALFYYVVHLFLIHAVALVAVAWGGYPWRTMVFLGSQTQASPLLRGRFGFSLGATWLLWAGIVLLLYPLCARWSTLKDRYKGRWWVSYV